MFLSPGPRWLRDRNGVRAAIHRHHSGGHAMKLGRSLHTLGCTLIVATMFAALPALAQEKKPNVVFILVDNVGWGDFSVYGGTTATPRIDKLASEGIRFNNY